MNHKDGIKISLISETVNNETNHKEQMPKGGYDHDDNEME
jgi:hypothetical protein